MWWIAAAFATPSVSCVDHVGVVITDGPNRWVAPDCGVRCPGLGDQRGEGIRKQPRPVPPHLILNTISWLVDEEDPIGKRPEPGETLEIIALEGGDVLGRPPWGRVG